MQMCKFEVPNIGTMLVNPENIIAVHRDTDDRRSRVLLTTGGEVVVLSPLDGVIKELKSPSGL